MLKRNPAKIREWQQRSRRPLKRTGVIKGRSKERSIEETNYHFSCPAFLTAHPVCPVTGGRTTEIHHSAKREGRWLNLQRYWIAVSREGHEYIEANKKWAEAHGLMVRINQTADQHIRTLISDEVDLHDPIFYKNWNNRRLLLTS